MIQVKHVLQLVAVFRSAASVQIPGSRVIVMTKLGPFHPLGQTDHLKQSNFPPGHIQLPPAMLVRSARRIMMMIVVPTFAHGHQGDQPVVPASSVVL